MYNVLLAGAVGGLSAFIFSIPAIVLEIIERGDVDNIPLLVDVKTIFGRKLRKEEVFLVALLVHIIVGFLFGAGYVLLTQAGWFAMLGDAYNIWSVLVYAVFGFLFVGFILFPLFRMGVCGRKEGDLVWLEIFVSMVLIGLSLWLCIQYYQPQFFA